MRIVVIIIEYVRRPPVAVSGQQLAVSNGRPTSHHESLATIFPPLLPNPGGPPDRFRRGRPDKASRCGNPAKYGSEKMPFTGRRPPVAVRKTMPHEFVMYITEKSRGSWLVARGPWLVKPCLMDLLCISPFIRGGPP